MTNRINWHEHLPGTAPSGLTTSGFITVARQTFSSYNLPPDVIARVEAAGCWIEGPRYFNALFSSEVQRPTDRTISAFLGSVAFGHAPLASQAHGVLTAEAYPTDELVGHLVRAMNTEADYTDATRLSNLAGAAQALTK